MTEDVKSTIEKASEEDNGNKGQRFPEDDNQACTDHSPANYNDLKGWHMATMWSKDMTRSTEDFMKENERRQNTWIWLQSRSRGVEPKIPILVGKVNTDSPGPQQPDRIVDSMRDDMCRGGLILIIIRKK